MRTLLTALLVAAMYSVMAVLVLATTAKNNEGGNYCKRNILQEIPAPICVILIFNIGYVSTVKTYNSSRNVSW